MSLLLLSNLPWWGLTVSALHPEYGYVEKIWLSALILAFLYINREGKLKNATKQTVR